MHGAFNASEQQIKHRIDSYMGAILTLQKEIRIMSTLLTVYLLFNVGDNCSVNMVN